MWTEFDCAGANGCQFCEVVTTCRGGQRQYSLAMMSPSLSRVVVVCASAGGLQPLRTVLDVLHADESAAVLDAMHQPAGAPSKLVSLLELVARVPVRWVTDGMQIEPGCVQVVPTGTSMAFDGSAFRARSPPHRSRTPFDDLLRQVARWFGDRSAAVVLSGAGSDSADGGAAVVGAGGHVYAQLPSRADFSSMAEAVIIRGLPSLVATPQAIAEHLNGKRLDVDGVEAGTVTVDAAVRMLVAGGGPDFRLYKPGLIARRMEHRARSLGHRSVQSYVDALAKDAAEVDALRQDLMISVTSSFRDPGMWDALAHTVIAPMLTASEANGVPRRAVRAWVAACATGEEAYSLAMLLAEAHLRLGLAQDFQVIATDVDERSVAHARTGVLSNNALPGIPERV